MDFMVDAGFWMGDPCVFEFYVYCIPYTFDFPIFALNRLRPFISILTKNVLEHIANDTFLTRLKCIFIISLPTGHCPLNWLIVLTIFFFVTKLSLRFRTTIRLVRIWTLRTMFLCCCCTHIFCIVSPNIHSGYLFEILRKPIAFMNQKLHIKCTMNFKHKKWNPWNVKVCNEKTRTNKNRVAEYCEAAIGWILTYSLLPDRIIE